MTELSTIALLERKPAISRDLFSRYWRDVHGVMAVRIPGFWSYTQHHVTPLLDLGSKRVEPFEGIAVVRFRNAQDRAGLIDSDVTRFIHRDEQNVFRRALLYNLEAGDSSSIGTAQLALAQSYFIVVPQAVDGLGLASAIEKLGVDALDIFDLRKADPAGWNDTDVSEQGASRIFHHVLQLWISADKAMDILRSCVAQTQGQIACYKTDACYEMVKDGRPTPLGLRGLDALRTIEETGASNQLERDVERAIYGPIADGI